MTDPLCTAFFYIFYHMWWDLHTEDLPTKIACRTWRPTISDKDHHIADSLIGLCIWINGWVLSFDFCFKPNNCLLICACYRLWCHRAITYVLLWSPCDLVSTKMLTLKKSKEEKKSYFRVVFFPNEVIQSILLVHWYERRVLRHRQRPNRRRCLRG